MATGDRDDMLARLRSLIPPWFPDQGHAPIIDAVLIGIAGAFAFVYDLYAYAALQVRIATATGAWLDLIAWDYLGGRVVRGVNESDAAWRVRIRREILRERATRAGLIAALTDLTGIAPAVFEPSLPADTGGYGIAGLLAYNVNGAYGSLLLPWHALIGAFRPATAGIPFLAGYGSTPGGYSQPSQIEYADIAQIIGAVTDADIAAAAEAVRPTVAVLTLGISNVVTLVPLTDETGSALTDEAGIPLYQD